MKKTIGAALAAVVALACAAGSAQAQSTSIYSEQDKLIRADRTVGTLGGDLFGDKINFYNGTLEFTQTDVSLPGNNNGLPVSVGRRLVPGTEVRVRGLPIRDASPLDTAGPFVSAERNLLLDRGWTFEQGASFWMPPIP